MQEKMKMTLQKNENYMYKDFIFLQDHLYFFLHFFFTFMEQLFLDDPILLYSASSTS